MLTFTRHPLTDRPLSQPVIAALTDGPENRVGVALLTTAEATTSPAENSICQLGELSLSTPSQPGRLRLWQGKILPPRATADLLLTYSPSLQEWLLLLGSEQQLSFYRRFPSQELWLHLWSIGHDFPRRGPRFPLEFWTHQGESFLLFLEQEGSVDEVSDDSLFFCRWKQSYPTDEMLLRRQTFCDRVCTLPSQHQVVLALCQRSLELTSPPSTLRRGPGLWRLGLETFSLSSGQLLSSFWPDHLSLPIRSLSFPSDDLLDHYLPSLSLASGPSDPNGSPSYFAALSLPLQAPSRPHDHLSRPAVPPQGVGSLFWLSSSLAPLSSLPWLGAFPSLVPSGSSLFGSDLFLDSWRLWRWLPSSPSPSSFLLLDSFPADPSSFFSLLAPSSSSPSSHPPTHFWSLLASPNQLLLSLRRSSDGSLLDSPSLSPTCALPSPTLRFFPLSPSPTPTAPLASSSSPPTPMAPSPSSRSSPPDPLPPPPSAARPSWLSLTPSQDGSVHPLHPLPLLPPPVGRFSQMRCICPRHARRFLIRWDRCVFLYRDSRLFLLLYSSPTHKEVDHCYDLAPFLAALPRLPSRGGDL